MELWLIAQGPDGRAVHVAVDAPNERTLGDVVESLARFLRLAPGPSDQPLALYNERLRTWLPNDQSLRSSGLRQGDRVAVAPRPAAPTAARKPVYDLVVLEGALAGVRAGLPEGTSTVGRADTNDVRLDDASVSAAHFTVRIEGASIYVTDHGASNGLVIGEVRLAPGSEHKAKLGEVLEAGRVRMAFEPRTGVRELAAEEGGWVRFNRPPRMTEPYEPPQVRIPAPPPDPRPARIPVLAALVPVLGAVGLWLLSENPATLLFAALAPLTAVFTAFVDSRRAQRGFRKGTEAYRARLAETRDEIDRARLREASNRADAAPDPSELLGRAEALSTRIWERRAPDRDFLELRVGLATQQSSIEVELEPGGNASLQEEAGELLAQARAVPNVPVTVPARSGAIGLSGPDVPVRSLARWLVLQAALLHSPRELTIVAAFPESEVEDWSWLKWLPHTRSPVRGEPRLATGSRETRALLASLDRLVEQRRSRAPAGGAPVEYLPVTLLVVHEAAVADHALAARLFDNGPAFGITAIWVGSSEEELPGACQSVVDLAEGGSSLTLTDFLGDRIVPNVKPDGVAMRTARAGARLIAPLMDTGAQDRAAGIPDRVSLFEVLELRELRSKTLVERWSDPPPGLTASVGMSAEGPYTIDLRADGPHGLVAGTSGSGKSELLRSIIASLASNYPPNRLSFLLIDYKGGAAFRECAGLPHTAGVVTDLDEALAERALESLRAELRRRELLLREHGASSLVELEQLDPASAPPSLVIVVDEFATLVTEVPRFVDGVVDIAQRGRSLGLHLLLATQRPRGAVSPTILANTNLRIALRVTDPSESTDVLDAPDAAFIPRALAGRAIARAEQGSLVQLQSAYSAARAGLLESETNDVEVSLLGFGRPLRTEGRAAASPSTTQLAQVGDAATTAVELAGVERPAPPWLPPLADVIALPDAQAAAADVHPRAVTVGFLDLPAEQRQPAAVVDLQEDGGLLVFGAGGAGKTTLLRTLAFDLASRLPPDELHLYGLDFDTHELTAIEALPHCGGVATGDEPERVLRLFTMLDRLIAERRRAGATAGQPTVVVLLDGYAGFAAEFEKIGGGELLETFQRLAAEGRAFDVYPVITADRRAAVPAALTGRLQGRVVLRMADSDEYAVLGVAARQVRDDPPPGRGFLDGIELQVAHIGANPSATAQVAALRELGESVRRSSAATAPPVTVLPETVARGALPKADGVVVPWGIRESDMEPLALDLEHGHFLVAGPRRSGRTTALATATRGLLDQPQPPQVAVLAPRSSPLVDVEGVSVVARGLAECDELAARLAADLETRTAASEPLVVVIDDGDELEESAAAAALLTLVRRGRDRHVRVLAAVERAAAHRAFGNWLREIRSDGSGLLLRPDLDVDGELFGVRLPRGLRRAFPPGRGYVVDAGAAELVQIAST